MKSFLLFIIKMYQVLVSPIVMQFTGAHCRFPQTCSAYAVEQIEKKGVIKGSVLALNRIMSCQPYKNKFSV